MARNPFAPLGRKFEKLGKLMQDPSTPLTKLARAAYHCGFNLQFRLVDMDGQSAAREQTHDEQPSAEGDGNE